MGLALKDLGMLEYGPWVSPLIWDCGVRAL